MGNNSIIEIDSDDYVVTSNIPFKPKLEEGETDFEFARSNIFELIGKGAVALNDLLDIAKLSQDPEAYDSVTKFIKTLVDTNKALLDLHQINAGIRTSTVGPKTINNNLFAVGTTADLQKMIESLKIEKRRG